MVLPAKYGIYDYALAYIDGIEKLYGHTGYSFAADKKKIIYDVNRLITKCIDKNLHSGRSPRSIAVACVYIVLALNGYRKKQEEMSLISNVHIVTIRKRYREIMEIFNIDYETP